jgi:hypothetical protein
LLRIFLGFGRLLSDVGIFDGILPFLIMKYCALTMPYRLNSGVSLAPSLKDNIAIFGFYRSIVQPGLGLATLKVILWSVAILAGIAVWRAGLLA